MFRTIAIFGAVAGLIVCVPFIILLTTGKLITGSLFTGYLIMLLALSMVFVGVKRVRDRDGGGVIRFGKALLVGLGISFVASLFYTVGWELTLQATHFAYVDTYSAAIIAHAKGGSPAALAKATAEAQAFRDTYCNPLYRLPETFIEIFPVGLVVSLVSAGLLRNSRILPARAAGA